MNMPFLPTRKQLSSKFHTPRVVQLVAAISSLFFVAMINDARAQESTTNTNEFLVDPYSGTLGFGSSLFGTESAFGSNSFGTLSLGGSGGGLPLDGGGSFSSQATNTSVMQDSSFPTQFNSGGDFFNNGATELGMWANSGAKQTVGWANLGTSGLTGTARNLQIGDVFTITVAATRAFGQIGFSLNAGGTQGGSYANNLSGSRMYISTDNFAAWSVKGLSGGATASLSYVPIESTYKDYRFTIRITSQTTADVFLTVDGTDYRAYNLTLAGSAGVNISALSIFGSDMWDGNSNDDAYWKQTSTIQDTGRVELGYFLGSTSTFTPGVIADGLAANSTSTSAANAVFIGGDSGSAVVLNQANTYSGATTVNGNATVRASHASAFGTTAGGVTVSTGGRLELSGNITIAAEALALNGVGVDTTGALRNTSGNNTWSGAITLSSNARINSDAGTLTLSGGISGGSNVLFVGGAANTTIETAAVTGNGGTQDGTTSVFKDGIGALTLGSANTYNGQTLHNGGTILIGNNSAFGNGTLQIHFANFSANKVLASTDGTARTIGNAMNIYGSNLTLGASDRTGSLVFSGNINLGNDTAAGNSRTITTASGTSHTFGGVVSGNTANTLIKTGAGALTLSGNNTTSGGVQLVNGTLSVGNNNALGSGKFTVVFGNDVTQTLASSDATSFTLGNAVDLFDDMTVGQTSGGTGSLNLSGNVFLGNEVDANRILTVNGSHTFSGIVSGNRGIVKQAAGQLTLSGNNTFTGGIYIDEGTINLNGGALGSGIIEIGAGAGGAAAAALKVTSGSFSRGITVNSDAGAGGRTIEFANTTGSATLSGTVALEKTVSASVADSAATGVLSGAISGVGGLTKTGNGKLTLSGANANSYTGLTTLSAGTLELNKASGNAIAGATTVSSGAVLLLSASNQVDSGAGDTVTLSGGTIRRGGNVSEVFGDLNLSATSFLDYGAANDVGTVRFGSYTPSSLLTVQNFLPGNKLQFGNSISSADLNNGSLFSFSNGFTTGTEGGFFTITAIPEPSTYLAAAGLLAMFLWPSRRRLIKDAKSVLGLRAPARDRLGH